MRVLVTRHRSAAERLESILRERGFETLTAPLLEIVDTGAPVDLAGVQAVLASSANGIEALARAVADRDIPILTVGDATAAAARQAGFETVESAGGDSDALVRLARLRCEPGAGRLLHVAGDHVAGNLKESLEKAGFDFFAITLYEAHTPDALDTPIVETVASGKIDAVLFYSPRTAASFVSLIEQSGVSERCSEITAVCLSQAVAQAAAGLVWHDVRVAHAPNGDAMLDALDSLREN